MADGARPPRTPTLSLRGGGESVLGGGESVRGGGDSVAGGGYLLRDGGDLLGAGQLVRGGGDSVGADVLRTDGGEVHGRQRPHAGHGLLRGDLVGRVDHLVGGGVLRTGGQLVHGKQMPQAGHGQLRGREHRPGFWWDNHRWRFAIEGVDFVQDTEEGGAEDFEFAAYSDYEDSADDALHAVVDSDAETVDPFEVKEEQEASSYDEVDSRLVY